jgi:hypothetical protein
MRTDIGLLKNEPADRYHAHAAVSHSKLEVFRKRPALYYGQFISGIIPRRDSPSLDFGRAFHCLVLDGVEEFEEQFFVLPDGMDGRTKAGKDYLEANAGRTRLAHGDWMLIRRMADSVLANELAAELLTDPDGETITEATFRTPKLSQGFEVQCRCDVYSPTGSEESAGEPYLVDLKTVNDIDDFPKHFMDYGYYRQAPFYQRTIATLAGHFAGVVEPRKFFFIAVEKSPPHGCTVFEADAASIALGLKEIDADLARLAECYRSSIWPNAPEFKQVYLPAWYLDRRTAEMTEAVRQAEMAAP